MDARFAALSLVVPLALTASVAPRDRSWDLGKGFTATVLKPPREPGNPSARRSLVVKSGTHVVRRFVRRNEGLGVQVADISGDGVKDILVLDYWDGSGACGEYRLFVGPRFRSVWRKQDCADTGIARFLSGFLVTWTVVGSSKTQASRGDIHCCWSRWRRTAWTFRSGHVVRVRSSVGPPPPERWRIALLPGTFQ